MQWVLFGSPSCVYKSGRRQLWRKNQFGRQAVVEPTRWPDRGSGPLQWPYRVGDLEGEVDLEWAQWGPLSQNSSLARMRLSTRTGFRVWVGYDFALYWIEVGAVLTIHVLERKEDFMLETVWPGTCIGRSFPPCDKHLMLSKYYHALAQVSRI